MEKAKYIDHTILKATATYDDILKLCAEANKYHFASVCVNPTNVAFAHKLLAGTEGGAMLCASIAVVAYSYMALVPVIQPPIIKLLTTKEERQIKMVQARPVSKREKILFPIVVMVVVILAIPSCAPLIGMLMLGNLIKESGVVPNLVDAAAKTLMYAITIFLGLSVGATAILTSF